MIYFTADTHFGHANIVKMCQRPYPDVDVMNEAMIAAWNERVQGNDTVYIIGDAMLLDLSFFRRDQIWFAEKDDKSCATELYSLASFSPRKGENVRKGYLQGRFGAIPFIGGDGQWQR